MNEPKYFVKNESWKSDLWSIQIDFICEDYAIFQIKNRDGVNIGNCTANMEDNHIAVSFNGHSEIVNLKSFYAAVKYIDGYINQDSTAYVRK